MRDGNACVVKPKFASSQRLYQNAAASLRIRRVLSQVRIVSTNPIVTPRRKQFDREGVVERFGLRRALAAMEL
jgi:hypothetical protein